MKTKRQITALAHPCYLAGQILHPRFAWRDGMVTVVLTVNAGYE
jgi:hypothetical protein